MQTLLPHEQQLLDKLMPSIAKLDVWKRRYVLAHFYNDLRTYPSMYADNHAYNKPTFPKVETANGLTDFVVKYLNWSGWRASRVNVAGQLIDKTVKQASGAVFNKKQWVKSSTTKGYADISSTIQGRSVMWEIKMKDKPSEAQLKMQQRERAAGGEYFFIHNPIEFFEEYDRLINPELFK